MITGFIVFLAFFTIVPLVLEHFGIYLFELPFDVYYVLRTRVISFVSDLSFFVPLRFIFICIIAIFAVRFLKFIFNIIMSALSLVK